MRIADDDRHHGYFRIERRPTIACWRSTAVIIGVEGGRRRADARRERAFCHPHPLGGRFNGPERGAWYAGVALETAQAEVAFHKSVELAEVGWTAEESITYDDYLSDVSAAFHDLRHAQGFRACLDPRSYTASQALAERLLEAGSLGVVFPSVRHEGGTCLACFRPALVNNVRRDVTYRFTFTGTAPPVIAPERAR